jgi:hypothetical protein
LRVGGQQPNKRSSVNVIVNWNLNKQMHPYILVGKLSLQIAIKSSIKIFLH